MKLFLAYLIVCVSNLSFAADISCSKKSLFKKDFFQLTISEEANHKKLVILRKCDSKSHCQSMQTIGLMNEYSRVDSYNSNNMLISGSNLLIENNNVKDFSVVYNMKKKKAYVELYDGNTTFNLKNMKCN